MRLRGSLYRSKILPSTVAKNLNLNLINNDFLLKEVCILSVYCDSSILTQIHGPLWPSSKASLRKHTFLVVDEIHAPPPGRKPLKGMSFSVSSVLLSSLGQVVIAISSLGFNIYRGSSRSSQDQWVDHVIPSQLSWLLSVRNSNCMVAIHWL
jgi:hypothetical protein